MKINETVTIIGGSGFIGSYVVKELAKFGCKIQVVAKHATHAQHLRTCGAVGQIALVDRDVTNFQELDKIIKASDYVVNLVGILFQKKRSTFKKMHIEVPSKIAELCSKHKVKKLIHISALGIDQSSKTSLYARSKLDGEKEVLLRYPQAIILRPSVVFGAEDNFMNLFAWISKFSPFLPLIGGGYSKFQPVYVEDVAKAIALCITETSHKFDGGKFNLGGPTKYTFREILTYILEVTDRRRLFVPIPFGIAKFKAFFLELMPSPLLTRDQVELLKYDNIVQGQNGLDVMKIKPTALEAIAPRYLG